jgi:Ca2+-binding RTX toxin-like protein
MFIESLENRRMLAASLNATTGLLTITGTDKADRILVRRGYDGKIVVEQATYIPRTDTTAASVVTGRWAFDATKVKSILANLYGANDFIDVGGTWDRPLAIPSTINAGSGNDTAYGGNGKDLLNGGAGRDALYGRGGDDILNGNDGSDYLNGGRGADQHNGGSGNDRIHAVDGASTDKIDGGSNDPVSSTNPGDVAFIDKGDVVTNVEKINTATTSV